MQKLQPRRLLSVFSVSHALRDSALCENLRCEPQSDRPLGRKRLLDVARDLSDELLLAREGPFFAQAAPELDDQAFAVEIALEIE